METIKNAFSVIVAKPSKPMALLSACHTVCAQRRQKHQGSDLLSGAQSKLSLRGFFPPGAGPILVHQLGRNVLQKTPSTGHLRFSFPPPSRSNRGVRCRGTRCGVERRRHPSTDRLDEADATLVSVKFRMVHGTATETTHNKAMIQSRRETLGRTP